MSRCTMYMDQKMQYCENVNCPQSDLYIQYNQNLKLNSLFPCTTQQANFKMQRAKNIQDPLEVPGGGNCCITY